MGSWWGSTQLAYKYSIILVSAIVVTFIAGIIKLYVTRKRVAKAQKALDIEAGEKTEEIRAPNRRLLGEGDLFGVRAIESGYFGGVSQSRSNSVANSPLISPANSGLESPSLISINSISNSASVSKTDLLSRTPAAKSTASLTLNKQLRPTLPLKKLRPSEAELSGRPNHAAVDVDMKAEMPPSPIAYKTPDLPLVPLRHPARTWSTYSGSLKYSPESSQEDLSIETAPPRMPAASLKHLSNSGSIEVEVGSPTVSIFPPTKPKKVAQRQSRAAFTGNFEDDASYIKQQQQLDRTTVPGEDRYKKTMTVELSHLSGISQWGEQVMADLAAQKSPTTPKAHPLSIFMKPEQLEPLNLDEPEPEQPKQMPLPTNVEEQIEREEPTKPELRPSHTKKIISSASSSVYSVEDKVKPTKEKHTRSSSEDSTKSIKRAKDSLKHARKPSREEASQQKRRSLDRDQIHYDPRPAARSRAGSVVGRTVDFDNPRSSPFSNQPAAPLAIVTSNPILKTTPINKQSYAISPSHAYQSSVSSYEDSDRDISPSHSAKSSASSFSIPVSRFSAAFKEPIVTVTAPTSKHSPTRPRSASNSSQTSVNDVYESYYRKSVIAQRASIVAELDVIPAGDGNLKANMASKKLVANLTLAPPTTLGYGGVDTIVEVETPMSSRFPGA